MSTHQRAPLGLVARFLPVQVQTLYQGHSTGRYKFLVKRDQLDQDSGTLWVDVPSLERYLATWPALARLPGLDLESIREAARNVVPASYCQSAGEVL